MRIYGSCSDPGIRTRLFCWSILATFLLADVSLLGKSVILPVEVIDDSADLTAEEFNSQHPGIDVSGYIPDEEGYYIEYTHENLTYYFGPIDQYEEAIVWKDKLMVIREEVISARLTLQKSEVRIYHFNHEILARAKTEIERQQAATKDWKAEVSGGDYEGIGNGGELGYEGELVIIDREAEKTGQGPGLFGKDSKELTQLGQQGISGRTEKDGQPLQIVQAGQQDSNNRSNRSSNQQSSRSSSSSSSGGGPPIPGGSSQPNRKLSWWEILRRVFLGN